MSHLIANSFASFKLTDKEVLEGSTFTTLQAQVLQNHLAVVAEEKIRLEFDPDPAKQLEFVQQESYKRGQLDFITYILEVSSTSQQELLNLDTSNSEA